MMDDGYCCSDTSFPMVSVPLHTNTRPALSRTRAKKDPQTTPFATKTTLTHEHDFVTRILRTCYAWPAMDNTVLL